MDHSFLISKIDRVVRYNMKISELPKSDSMQWGMQYAVGMQYTVGTQYTVGVSAKRSTHTVDLANMGGGDHYL